MALASNVGLRHHDIWAYDENGERHRLTTDHASSQPSFFPDGSRIAFVSARNGGFAECCGFDDTEIWVMNADGSDQQPLTDGPGDSDPAWSPDGELIAFTRALYANNMGDIYVMEPDGSNVRLVADAPERSTYGRPAWSPDGDRIAFVRGAEDQPIMVVDREGGDVEVLADVAEIESSYEIAWSPDGNQIAFVSGDLQTFVVDIESGDVEELELTSIVPQWLPDGRLAYFDRRQDEDGDWGLWQLTVLEDGDESDVGDVEPFGYVWTAYAPDWPDCPDNA